MAKKRTPQFETHGQVDSDAPTNLEQIWGYNELARYGTLDEKEYQGRLDEMNRTDLESHARAIGLVPIHDTTRLKKNLIREFQSFTVSLKKPVQSKLAPKTPTKEVDAILKEGR